MSEYLNEPDSESDEEPQQGTKELSEEEQAVIFEQVLALKTEGNQKFSAADFEDAIKLYTQAIQLLKVNKLNRDPILFLNRSASYISLQRFVPALHDANQGKLSCL
jgi:hypothetical protein